MSRQPLCDWTPLLGVGATHDAPRVTTSSKKKHAKVLYCEAHTLFLAVASDTLSRVHRQRQMAPERLRPMLGLIERYLFSPGLSATRIYLACNIKDRSISTAFRRAIGATPWRYIEQCRMEVGERLVRQTQIKITWISAMLGYSSLKVFSGAFGRLTNERPLTYRKQHQAEALEEALSQRSEELERIVKLRRALEGTLESAEAATLIDRLHVLYPTTGGDLSDRYG